MYCKAFAIVKKHYAIVRKTLVDMCRVMSKPVFEVTDQLRQEIHDMDHLYVLCGLMHFAMPVRTSTMDSARQPPIRVLKMLVRNKC